MTSRTPTRAIGASLGVAAVLATILLLWPVQLGGWAAYAVVNGTSMEPSLRSDDLVLTRKQGDYGVGDAVLYHSDLLDASLLHRIVADDGGRFTFRGDNRTENDPERLTEGDILGSQWVTIPGAGRPLHWLAEPVHLAILVFALVLLVLAGGREVSRRRRRGVDPAPVVAEPEPRALHAGSTSAARGLLLAGVIALVGFGALTFVAWMQPAAKTRTDVGGYAHTGSFSYTADARRGAAYPDGAVTTAQPVFVRLGPTVAVAFDYRFTASRPANVRGGIGLDVVLSDGAGWERTLPLAAAQPFEGPMAHVEGVLDLRRLLGIMRRVESSTGAELSQARLAVVPRVGVAGYAGDHAIDEQFAPELPFTLDAVSLRLVEPQAEVAGNDPDGAATTASSPLAPRSEGSTIVTLPASLAIGSLASLEVDRARSIGAIGVLASGAAILLACLLLLRRGAGSEADRIEARYGSRIVRARATIPEGRWVTELHDVESLIQLAESYDRVVLRVSEPEGGQAFLVDDGIAVYRYRSGGAGPVETSRTLPAHGR